MDTKPPMAVAVLDVHNTVLEYIAVRKSRRPRCALIFDCCARCTLLCIQYLTLEYGSVV